MAIWSALFHPYTQAIHTVCQGIASAIVTSAGLYLSLACALIALSLKLLNHTRSDLLSLNHLALALTVWAGSHVIGVVSSTTATVRADNFPIVRQFEVCSRVELVQCHSDF